MKNLEQARSRFLKDPLPMRLAGLASTLGRVASSARHEKSGQNVAMMLEESQYYIEWTAADTEPEIAEELVNIQVLIAFWRKVLQETRLSPVQRGLLSTQAKQWSDRVLGHSGLSG